MKMIIWIILTFLVLLGILFSIKLSKNKKKGIKHETDYYTFFVMGIIWVGAGISIAVSSGNWALFIMGIIFMAIGLRNKDKWKRNHKKWKDLTEKQKRWKLWIIVILGILVLAGVVVYWLAKKGLV